MVADPETTDLTLFVRTSAEEEARWNRRRIVEALIRETGIAEPTAEEISREVEKQIFALGISQLTTGLIRELVDAQLAERGLEQARRLHARLGYPLYDVRELILHQNRENANVPHAPEGTSLALVEGIKREFALNEVFSREVGDAHASGDLHLHGLGHVDRPYSSCQTLESLKRCGLCLPHSVTVAGPARHAEVLLAHMVRFAAALQGHFAGQMGWDAVNLSFAPYLHGMGEREIEQFAQMLVYEFSQLTSARGGQAIFTDIHLYWEVPAALADRPAIGPGGKPTGRTCGEYGDVARALARSLMRVYRQGDAAGKPFVFPRPILHITGAFFATAGHEAFLAEVCDAASAMGNPHFVLDRSDGTAMATGGGLDPAWTDLPADPSQPWGRRCATIQNVTLNLPRLGYRSQGDDNRFSDLLAQTVALAVQAHLQKRAFIEELLALGASGPLALLAMPLGGEPYLRMAAAVYSIGVTGLNELVQLRTGRQLHETDAALAEGVAIVEKLARQVAELGREHGMRLLLEQTPAETTAHRFARLDLKHFSPLPGRYVRGDLAQGGIYYTNSTHLHPAAAVEPLERVRREGLFHPFFRSGAMTHLELGAARPEARALAEVIRRAWNETACNRIGFSPEFTACRRCGATSRGIAAACPNCGSADIDGLARITEYVSWVSGWNRGKKAELKDRNRNRGCFPEASPD